MTLHSEQVHGFFGVPVDHLSATHELASHFQGTDLSNTVVVSPPDFGYAKVASKLARLLDVPVAAGSKRRLADDKVVIDRIVGDVEGKKVIILDDEVATAGSMIELMDRLREYDVEEISVATTHGLFVGKAVERLNAQSDIREILTTNTVPLRPDCTPPTSWPYARSRRCSPRRYADTTPVSRSARCSPTKSPSAENSSVFGMFPPGAGLVSGGW